MESQALRCCYFGLHESLWPGLLPSWPSILSTTNLNPIPSMLMSGMEQTANHLHELPRTTKWYRKRGRPSRREKAAAQQYLSQREEKALADYARRMARSGHSLPIKSLRSLAQSIRHYRESVLPMSELDGPPLPGKNWSQGFYKRHPELRARRTRAIDRDRHDAAVYSKTMEWFDVIREVLDRSDILQENVYNMDETGVMLSVLGSLKVLVERDDTQTKRPSCVQRTLITAIECISADGRCLDPLIIWPAATHRSNWTAHPTPGWHFACSSSGYTDTAISLYWVQHVFDPLTKRQANGKPRVLISDGFGTHESLEVLSYCFKNNILLCRLPSHTSHKLQPCDIGVFGPLKTSYREQAERLYRGGANTIGKQHFTLLYSRARQAAFTARNIRASWSKAGLYPFNPARVLQSMKRPDVETEITSISSAETFAEVSLSSPRSTRSSSSLHTPTTFAGFDRLRDSFAKKLADADDRSRRCLLKLCHAAEKAYADRAILYDENKLLFEQNNERTVRKTAKSTVVGRAKVMSYQDILDAQRRRSEREAKQTSKNSVPEDEVFQAPVAQMLSPAAEEALRANQEAASMGLTQFCHIVDARQIG